MSLDRRDYMRRFINLIDQLYYLHRNVVIEADVPLETLFDCERDVQEASGPDAAYTKMNFSK